MGLKIERRTTVVYLYTSDDQERLSDLARATELAVGTEGTPRRVTDEDPARVAAETYDAFVAEAAERATQVRLTALPGRAWRALLAEHPPRPDVLDGEGNPTETFPQDRMAGFNVDTLAPPLVQASIDADQFDDADELEAFADDLSDPDFSRVFSAAVRLNTEAGPDPKFRASSWLDLRSAAMSRLDPPSDSPPARSTD